MGQHKCPQIILLPGFCLGAQRLAGSACVGNHARHGASLPGLGWPADWYIREAEPRENSVFPGRARERGESCRLRRTVLVEMLRRTLLQLIPGGALAPRDCSATMMRLIDFLK